MIAAGGTGGHIYPAIAVAKEIMCRDDESVVKFVGTAHGLETRLVPNAGFELGLIRSSGLKNVGTVARLRGISLLPMSLKEARKQIRDFKPQVVVGAGGYVSGPVVFAAALMRIPTMVMESNAFPGWTNRVLARFVDRATVSFEESLPYFRGKGVFTGNPVRREFFNIPTRDPATRPFSLLVFGGSQGAHAINVAMIEALPNILHLQGIVKIIHQTGERDYDLVSSAYLKAGWTGGIEVKRYIDDMVHAFAESDAIICRAGATTSAELIAARKPAVMIPLPLADNHQRKNAEALRHEGVARMILQAELTGRRLAAEIDFLLSNPDELRRMQEASLSLSRIDSAAKAVDLIENLCSHSLN